MSECPYCHGRGVEYVEPGLSSLCYDCPDCNGTGYIDECDLCGNTKEDGMCRDCETICDYCGCVRVVETEMATDTICTNCMDDVISARRGLLDRGISTHKITDDQILELSNMAWSEMLEYCKAQRTAGGAEVSGRERLDRYFDSLKLLVQHEPFNCQPLCTIRCGVCHDYGIDVVQLDSEADADGVFENWRAVCKNCGARSLDMDDPEYAIEVLEVGDGDGLADG